MAESLMGLPLRAMLHARQIHREQRRKYTDNPYFDHLAEVAGIVASVAGEYGEELAPAMIATAWLHDAIEDQGETVESLASKFGIQVAKGVEDLSNMEKGNRAERHEAALSRLSRAPGWVQTIKTADLISNSSSILEHDPKFAVVYLKEKRNLLRVMDRADPHLRTLALGMVA